MGEKRAITLLDFAITASVAVVPLLLAVLVIVGAAAAAAKARHNGDQHVSLRQVAALKTFEHAIVRRNLMAGARPSPQALIDGVPQCRAEWTGGTGMMSRVRQVLTKGRNATLTPAQRLTGQF